MKIRYVVVIVFAAVAFFCDVVAMIEEAA